MSFLQGQMMPIEDKKQSFLHIYSIARSETNGKEQRTIIKRFWNKFTQSVHTVEVGGDKTPRKLQFRFINGTQSMLNPHLYIYPSAGVGILSFAISLTTENATSEDLKLLNYHLHKIFHPLAKCVCRDLSLTGEEKPEIKAAKTNLISQARSFIGRHVDAQSKQNPGEENEELEFSWNMQSLCCTLLKDVQGPVNLFSPSRVHLFTIASIDDSTNNQYSSSDIIPELYSLSRCVNNKYMLPVANINQVSDILQTFENTYMASCVEGSAFIAVLKKENKEFFANFRNTVAMRYFWIYLLAMVQRYSLLNIDRFLTKLSFNDVTRRDSVQKYNNLLWQYLGTIQEVKVRCHFTDISCFSQHNEFYKFCCDKLHVNIAYDEIDKKTKALNLTISHDMQIQQEEEMKRQEKRDLRLNLFLGILAALQAIGIIYQFLEALCFDHNFYAAGLYFGLIVLAVIIVVILYSKKM